MTTDRGSADTGGGGTAATRAGCHVRNRLVSGVLVLVPLAITLAVLSFIFNLLTGFMRPLLRGILVGWPEYVLTAIALVVMVFVVYVVGIIAAHIIGRRFLSFGESLIMRVPVVKTIYAATKQVLDTFSRAGKANFKAVVLIDFPRAGSRGLAFVTGSMKDANGTPVYRVFVPTAPNPTSGFLVLLPPDQVRFTDISVEDGVKMLISGGVLSPETFREVPPPDDMF